MDLLIDSDIEIIIKTVQNETHSYIISPTVTILSLKRKLKETTLIPEERQRLIYRGEVLQDSSSVKDYRITSGHVIHLVVRPENYRELIAQANGSNNTTSNNNISSIRESLGNSRRANTEFRPQTISSIDGASLQSQLRNGSPYLDLTTANNNPPSNEPSRSNFPITSLEHVRQGLLSLNTYYSTVSSDNIHNYSLPNNGRRYYMGQWVDVKDTVNQWLESTIIDINEDRRQVYIHYNGWPSRWDEWIDMDSTRIAPFRTRTVHLYQPNHISPAPNAPMLGAPITGVDDIRLYLPEVHNNLHRLLPLVERAMILSQRSLSQEQESTSTTSNSLFTLNRNQSDRADGSTESLSGGQAVLQALFNSLNNLSSGLSRGSSSSSDAIRARGMPWDNNNLNINSFNTINSSNINGLTTNEELRLISRDLCPIFDRLGRLLTDTSIHLQRYANNQSDSNTASETAPMIRPSTSNNVHVQSLENAMINLFRPRQPSPPPERVFRSVIETSNRPTNQTTNTNSTTETSANSSSHLDIHIAIIAPQRRNISTDISTQATTATSETSTTTSSQTQSSNTLELQSTRLVDVTDRLFQTNNTSNDHSSQTFNQTPFTSLLDSLPRDSLTNRPTSSPGRSLHDLLTLSNTDIHTGGIDLEAENVMPTTSELTHPPTRSLRPWTSSNPEEETADSRSSFNDYQSCVNDHDNEHDNYNDESWYEDAVVNNNTIDNVNVNHSNDINISNKSSIDSDDENLSNILNDLHIQSSNADLFTSNEPINQLTKKSSNNKIRHVADNISTFEEHFGNILSNPNENTIINNVYKESTTDNNSTSNSLRNSDITTNTKTNEKSKLKLSIMQRLRRSLSFRKKQRDSESDESNIA